MPMSSYIPAFMEMMNQPSYGERQCLDREKQYQTTLDNEERLFKQEERKLKREANKRTAADAKKKVALTGRREAVEETLATIRVYREQGAAAEPIVLDVWDKLEAGEHKDLVPLLRDSLAGSDPIAIDQLMMEQEMISRQLGEEVKGSGAMSVLLDGTIGRVSERHPLFKRVMSANEKKAREGTGLNISDFNAAGGINNKDFTKNLKKVTGFDEAGKGLTLSEKTSVLRSASKLPNREQANAFLAEQTDDATVAFESEGEFLRAKAAYATNKSGYRMQVGPDNQILFETGDGISDATIGRKGAEQGLAAQDRYLLDQIGKLENLIQGLPDPESFAGVEGWMADAGWIGVLAQLPGGATTLEATSAALGVPLKPDEFEQIKTARSALTSIQGNARVLSRGVQDDRNASTAEKAIADQIVRMGPKDDYDAVMSTLELTKALVKSRSASLLENQGMKARAEQTATNDDGMKIYYVDGKWLQEDGTEY